jgi:glutathione synthase/RimK-type ligase-like ATP-grasp enzyme
MISAYPPQTRLVEQAATELGLAFEDLDGGGGYLFAVSDGARRYVGGGGAVTPYPLNGAAAVQVARDKAHAAAVLANAGLPVIEGRLFFTTDRRIRLRAPGREVADALGWIETANGPVFCKPNTGSGGDFAEIVEGPAAFRDYVERVAPHHEAVLMQPVIAGDEYRVFVLDGEAVFATAKAELTLTGDGVAPLSALLERHNTALAGTGVSATPAGVLINPAAVPAPGERVIVGGRRNLAAGGGAQILEPVPATLADLSIQACAQIGLRIGGVDLFDTPAGLLIIEVNGNPALTSLAEAGREDLALSIWRRVLSAWMRT